MSKSNYASYYQSNGRREPGPYIVDGGCFITQSNTLFVIDPSDMPTYIKCIAKSVLGDLSTGLNSAYSKVENAKGGERSRMDVLEEEKEISCCLLNNAKCGMWTVYAVCEDFSCGICFGEEEFPQFDESENSRVLSLVILNKSDIHMNMITPDFINDLNWESLPCEYMPPSPPLPPGVCHKPSVNVYSGQLGIFCQESIKLPPSVTTSVNTNTHQDVHYTLIEKIHSWLASWFSRLVQLTCTGNQIGIMDVVEAPVGVVCASGLGDQGEYEVQVLKDSISDEIYACRIVFMRGN